jgi:hypothetical protein
VKLKSIYYEKLILAIAVIFAPGSALHVSAQETQRVKFYYYPSSNVCFNVSNGDYWYCDEPKTKWIEVKTLPATLLGKAPKYTVYYNGPEVWRENDLHAKKYKVKKDKVKKR